jgi:hypothetical protein
MARATAVRQPDTSSCVVSSTSSSRPLMWTRPHPFLSGVAALGGVAEAAPSPVVSGFNWTLSRPGAATALLGPDEKARVPVRLKPDTTATAWRSASKASTIRSSRYCDCPRS